MAIGFKSYVTVNDTAFQNTVQRGLAAVGNLKIPFGLIALDFYKSEKAIFKLSGPGQYPDLSPKYKEFKEGKIGHAYPILKFSGALERSVTSNGDANSIYINDGKVLGVGTRLPYGIYHQSDDPRKKIPLRKFLFIGPESSFATSEQQGRLARWSNIINNYVLRQMGVPVELTKG